MLNWKLFSVCFAALIFGLSCEYRKDEVVGRTQLANENPDNENPDNGENLDNEDLDNSDDEDLEDTDDEELAGLDAGTGGTSSEVTNANCSGAHNTCPGCPPGAPYPTHVSCSCSKTTVLDDGTVITQTWDASYWDWPYSGDWGGECSDDQAEDCASACAQ